MVHILPDRISIWASKRFLLLLLVSCSVGGSSRISSNSGCSSCCNGDSGSGGGGGGGVTASLPALLFHTILCIVFYPTLRVKEGFS